MTTSSYGTILPYEEVQVIFNNDAGGNKETDPHYVVTIRVKTMQYHNGNFYYDIGYKYKFVPGDLDEDKIVRTKVTMHPFYQRCSRVDNPNPQCGDIVKKNKMTDEMVAHLMMDDLTLAKHTGMSTVQRYRASIMECLSILWD